ncbi:FKRP protein, partial [Caloenas nicobarica]|nr:FKRP protein [Caloenas nicobarica]
MRVRPSQAAIAGGVALNLILLLYWRWGASPPASCRGPRAVPGVTVVLFAAESSEDADTLGTSRSFAALPVPVLLVAEVAPYPPISLPVGVSLLRLRPAPEGPPIRPELHVRTRHVAFVPDGARAVPGLLERMRDVLEDGAGDGIRVVAAPVGMESPRCREMRVDARGWTVWYGPSVPAGSPGAVCGALDGPSVLLLRTRDLFSLPFPLVRPAPTALFIQASLRRWRLRVLPAPFPASLRPPLSPHERWKTSHLAQNRHRRLMDELGVKREALADGADRWYGCTKATPRCFGTVHARTPQYLLSGRWTPPCCLRALRETARHVVATLEGSGVRYWLEGGTLLGAVRLGDIIPWDYDVDLGIYREDVGKCRWLAAAAAGTPVEDDEGFYWEKAPEGEFYRVHFSRANRLHVDLWPFYLRGDTMTKDTWLGHPQDVEFPERFLRPRVPVPFGGFTAMGPNSPREFLELKFGAGAVENPEYPNPGVRRL